MSAATRTLFSARARSVLDLGCGSGIFLSRLAAHPVFARLVGLDKSMPDLARAERRLGPGRLAPAGRVSLYHGSCDVRDDRLAGCDAAVMLETIEHIDPARLSAVEHALFACYRPATVLITTPNREYNALYGLPEGAFRHPEHRFEWSRAKFRSWVTRAAARNHYAAAVCGIGEPDPFLGNPTQMAVFSRNA